MDKYYRVQFLDKCILEIKNNKLKFPDKNGYKAFGRCINNSYKIYLYKNNKVENIIDNINFIYYKDKKYKPVSFWQSSKIKKEVIYFETFKKYFKKIYMD